MTKSLTRTAYARRLSFASQSENIIHWGREDIATTARDIYSHCVLAGSKEKRQGSTHVLFHSVQECSP